MTTATRIAAFTAALAFLLVSAPAEARRARSVRLRTMTFNIRFDFQNDGRNRWANRVDLVAKTIADTGAHVVCLQEDKEDQVADLQQRLPGYEFVGRGRNATGSGERCAILFDKSMFRAEDHGDFWLSDTPEVPGSNTWGDRYPRKATWALLETRKGKKRLLVINTHYVEGDENDRLRRKSSEVILNWLKERVGPSDERSRRGRNEIPVLVAGDFNDDENSASRKMFTEEGPLRFRDTWEEAKPADPRPGTYGGFKGLQTVQRIDWLLVAGPIKVLGADKLEEPVDGRYPSDHYPVLADIEVF